jgi:hypothetical protein
MILDARGPEQIRAAFTTAITTTSECVDDLADIAAVLGEAADRYETLHMCDSTLEHLRDGGTAVTAAAAALDTAHIHLQAALADFDNRDGRVADAVAEAENLMQHNADAGVRIGVPPAPDPDGTAMTHDPADTPPRQLAPDPLKVAARLVLADGETFVGSAPAAKGADGGLLLAAAVDTPTGRQVHLGVPILDEDRKQWRGAHAPARENVVNDEDGETYGVDTGADVTVILDAADAARLPDVADDVIARATAADKEFRQLCMDYERLYQERAALEAQRFADRDQAEKKISLDAQETRELDVQLFRRRFLDECAARLDPADRAAYDALQEQIDAAGREMWEPGRDEQAAALCGLSVDEWREAQTLQSIRYLRRSREQHDRLKQLDHGLPALLEQQAAIVCGLTIDEFQEMMRLERRGRAHRRPYEQARLDELDASPRGATASTARQTMQMRGRYIALQNAHHSAKTDLTRTRRDLAALEAVARPLDPDTAAELHRVSAELAAASDRHEQMAGGITASAQIPARNGGALVIDAIQQDDGGVRYHIDRKPADADDDWYPGSISGDPFTVTAAGLRKAAALAAALAAPV